MSVCEPLILSLLASFSGGEAMKPDPILPFGSEDWSGLSSLVVGALEVICIRQCIKVLFGYLSSWINCFAIQIIKLNLRKSVIFLLLLFICLFLGYFFEWLFYLELPRGQPSNRLHETFRVLGIRFFFF